MCSSSDRPHTYMCMSQIDQRKYVCMNIFIKVGDYAEQLTRAFEGYDPRRYRRVRMYVCIVVLLYCTCNQIFLLINGMTTQVRRYERPADELPHPVRPRRLQGFEPAHLAGDNVRHGYPARLQPQPDQTALHHRDAQEMQPQVRSVWPTGGATMQLGVMAMVGVVEGKHVFSANTVQNYLRRAIVGVPPFDPIAANVCMT